MVESNKTTFQKILHDNKEKTNSPIPMKNAAQLGLGLGVEALNLLEVKQSVLLQTYLFE